MRLFTAVPLPAPVHRSLVTAVDPVTDLDGGPRWSARDLWHVTLVFLGEVDDAGVPRLRRELAGAVAAAGGPAPFTVRLAGAGTFPSGGRPQVLWVGVDGEVERLAALARAVRRAARRGRVEVERRPYHPHVTLGRWRARGGGNRAAVERLADYVGPEFVVDRFTLYRSHPPTEPGAQHHHEPLDTWPLPPDPAR